MLTPQCCFEISSSEVVLCRLGRGRRVVVFLSWEFIEAGHFFRVEGLSLT